MRPPEDELPPEDADVPILPPDEDLAPEEAL
jgi:hypothetical protein